MISVVITLLVAPAVPPGEGIDTDRPHRQAGQVLPINMTLAEAQACIAREMDKKGSVLVLPVTGGSDIDFTLQGGLFVGGMGEPYISFRLRDDSGLKLTTLYRRPLSEGGAVGIIKGLRKRCLAVAE